jgi:hypothetical protein
VAWPRSAVSSMEGVGFGKPPLESRRNAAARLDLEVSAGSVHPVAAWRRSSESGKPKPRSPAGTAARPGPSRRRGRDVANRHEGLEERASGEERRTAVRSSLNPALRFTRRVWCDLACDPALRLAATVCGGDAQLFRDCLRLADYVSTKQGNRTALRLQVRASRRSASVRCPTFNC